MNGLPESDTTDEYVARLRKDPGVELDMHWVTTHPTPSSANGVPNPDSLRSSFENTLHDRT